MQVFGIFTNFAKRIQVRMNKEWSELNRTMQNCLKKKDSFAAGLDLLFELRNQLMSSLSALLSELPREDFSAMPFINSEGYHNKTIAYSVWHIFRIEDIVVHTLMKDDKQIFFTNNYQKLANSPIITTGNELIGHQIADFSMQLDLKNLYAYAFEVKKSTEEFLAAISFEDMRERIGPERKTHLISLNVVKRPEADFLIDYWCGKDFRGLIQMPLSRHWIMHCEAAQRIANKLLKR